MAQPFQGRVYRQKSPTARTAGRPAFTGRTKADQPFAGQSGLCVLATGQQEAPSGVVLSPPVTQRWLCKARRSRPQKQKSPTSPVLSRGAAAIFESSGGACVADKDRDSSRVCAAPTEHLRTQALIHLPGHEY